MSTLPFANLWDDYSLRPYLGEIRRRHGIIETLAMPSMQDLPPARIETLFVSPLLAESAVNADSEPATWPFGQGLFQALEAQPRLVVLGDPGGGKTTLSNWLAWRLSVGLASPLPAMLAERVPIPCVLRDMTRDFFERTPQVADLALNIARYLLGDAADAELLASLQARVAAGRYVLILDGVDEIAVPQRKVVAEWLRQAHAQDAVVLATSRIVGYDDWKIDQPMPAQPDVEMPEEARLQMMRRQFAPQAEADRWAAVRYLLPFDPPRIAAFVENWYRQRSASEQEVRQKSSDLLASIAQSDTTQQLARTPNLLSMMAIVHRERAHLPDGKALLYEEIANAYINTIDQQRKILPNDALAPYAWKARKGWLAYIAFQMQLRRSNEDNDAGVLVAEAEVLAWLTEAMRLSGVAQPEATAAEYLRWVARRSGLLLPRGAGRYAFVHLSFQEYFCACHLASRIVSPAFVRDKLKPDELVTKAALAKWGQDYLWRETLVNLFELLSAEQDADWVDDLTGIIFGDFEDEAQFDSFFDDRPDLVARLIQDRHVRLKKDWQERLASRCCYVARYDSVSDLVWQVVVRFGYVAELNAHFVPTTKLRTIVAKRFELADLSPLMECSSLQYLRLGKTIVSDLNPLAELSQLEELTISGDGIADLRPLMQLSNLRTLSLNETGVSDLQPLAGLINLQSLSLNRTKVSDLQPLAGLINLRSLSLDGTRISDLRPLAGLSNLGDLAFSETEVFDLKPLLGLSKLWFIDLSRTTVLDLTPLAGLVKLGLLFIRGTNITDVSALAHLTELKIYGLPDSPPAAEPSAN